MGFYDQIEEPVRPLVRVLRDNGINTTCSCGHKMTIQADLIPDGTLQVMHNVIYNYLSENKKPISYTITIHHEVINGLPWRTYADIYIGDFFTKELEEK